MRATGDDETRGRTVPEVRVVEAWHEALNAGDTERLAALSRPDVEMGGPRGTVRGTHVLREWVGHANVRLVPLRYFHDGGTVVVEEEAEWRSPETGEAIGADTVASVFVVRDGRVARVSRYADLADALEAADLGESQEKKPDQLPT